MTAINQNNIRLIVNGEPHDATVYNRPVLDIIQEVNNSATLNSIDVPFLNSVQGKTLDDTAQPESNVLWSSSGVLEYLGWNPETGMWDGNGVLNGVDSGDFGGGSTVVTHQADQAEVGALTYFAHTRLAGAVYGGSTNPTSTVRLNYDGNFHATTFIEPSDIRLKTDLEVIGSAVAKLENISGYTFTMKDSGERKTGLIAQEVADILPEAVTGTEEDGYGVAYGNIVGILVQAVKELNERIKELESK